MNTYATRPGSRTDTGGIALGLALIPTGLMAGVYYAYSCSVMPGLGRADDQTFVTAMRDINDAIQNPVFFASFFGALVVPAVAAVLERRHGHREAARWVVAALALYTVTSLGVTMAVNVPLNDQLASSLHGAAAARSRFEGTWNAFNAVRALGTTAALACLGRALVLHGRHGR